MKFRTEPVNGSVRETARFSWLTASQAQRKAEPFGREMFILYAIEWLGVYNG